MTRPTPTAPAPLWAGRKGEKNSRARVIRRVEGLREHIVEGIQERAYE